MQNHFHQVFQFSDIISIPLSGSSCYLSGTVSLNMNGVHDKYKEEKHEIRWVHGQSHQKEEERLE